MKQRPAGLYLWPDLTLSFVGSTAVSSRRDGHYLVQSASLRHDRTASQLLRARAGGMWKSAFF